jgi:hypothetical protein
MTRSASERAAIDLRSGRNVRRAVMISNTLAAMSLPHDLVLPLAKFVRRKALAKLPIDRRFCRLRWRRNGPYRIVFSDREADGDEAKHVLVCYDAEKAQLGEESDLFLPLLFHPNLLTGDHYREAENLAKSNNRPIGILFAGNCDRETYDKARIGRNFGLMNRFEIYRAAIESPGDRVWIPESREGFETRLAAGELRSKLVWIDTKRFRISRSEWLSLLAKARYFLCTTGVHYPFCHNLNEAMACGTVPVLEYPYLYHPPLSDGLDCIQFSGAQELLAKIREALAEDRLVHWQKRSEAASHYHEQHLSLGSLIGKLEAFLADHARKKLVWHMAGK